MAKVMIVGSGAREHEIALSYMRSKNVSEVLVTPGNDGMINNRLNREPANIIINKSSSLKDPSSILLVAQEYKPDLVDVAQDDALAAGTVDLLEKNGFRVFGPSKLAAQIEWDKEWSRSFMLRHGIPVPEYKSFSDIGEGRAYACDLLARKGGVFFKAAGLYAGKGVIPAFSREEVEEAARKIHDIGEASRVFLVEEAMVGEEFSYYAIVDGRAFQCFKSSQDNKRVNNRDQGPNTGGMGANAPALITRGLEKRIEEEIISPAVRGMLEEGRSYKGVLYLGGMVCKDGSLKVVEFNSRWGDPECHVVLPGVISDYFDLVSHAVDGTLQDFKLEEDDISRVCIISASTGYPGDYQKGKKIWIDNEKIPAGIHLLSAGIQVKDGQIYTGGGRVFSVVAEGRNVIEARMRALQGIACCSIEDNGLHYRTDIAWRDVQRVQK